MEEPKELKDITQSSLFQDATELHQRIIANSMIAANSLLEMCKCLKQMRDRKQYIYLGYDSFDDYAEKAVNIRARQAYNYIAALERLGPDVLQANANLGITKLKLLSEIPESMRDELMDGDTLDDMSTRELQSLKEQLTKAREQISMLTDAPEENQGEKNRKDHVKDLIINANKKELIKIREQLDEARERIFQLANDVSKKQDDIETAQEERDRIQAELEKLKNEPEKSSVDIDAVKKEAVKAANAEADKKLQKAIDAAKKEKEKEIAAAEQKKKEDIEKVKKSVAEQYQKQLDDIAREKEESLKRSMDLEKKLAESNSSSIILSHLFSEWAEIYSKMLSKIKEMPEADQSRYKMAIMKSFDVMKSKMEENE